MGAFDDFDLADPEESGSMDYAWGRDRKAIIDGTAKGRNLLDEARRTFECFEQRKKDAAQANGAVLFCTAAPLAEQGGHSSDDVLLMTSKMAEKALVMVEKHDKEMAEVKSKLAAHGTRLDNHDNVVLMVSKMAEKALVMANKALVRTEKHDKEMAEINAGLAAHGARLVEAREVDNDDDAALPGGHKRRGVGQGAAWAEQLPRRRRLGMNFN